MLRHLIAAIGTTSLILAACGKQPDAVTSGAVSTTAHSEVTQSTGGTVTPGASSTTADGEGTQSAGGVVIPRGLRSGSEIIEAIESYTGNLVIDWGSRVETSVNTSVNASVNTYDSETDSHYDLPADGGSYTSTTGTLVGRAFDSRTLITKNGERYEYEYGGDGLHDGEWVLQDAYTTVDFRTAGAVAALMNISAEVGVSETATGYSFKESVLMGENTQDETCTITLDANRTLTAATCDIPLQLDGVQRNEHRTITFTYPAELDLPEAPETFFDNVAQEVKGAETNLHSAAAEVQALLTTSQVSEVFLEELQLQHDANMAESQYAYFTTTSTGPYDVGFANDGHTIELVVSDGQGLCLRATIDPKHADAEYSSANSFECATNADHTVEATPSQLADLNLHFAAKVASETVRKTGAATAEDIMAAIGDNVSIAAWQGASYSPEIVGVAGTDDTIELVTFDGVNHCYRATLHGTDEPVYTQDTNIITESDQAAFCEATTH